MVGRKGDVFVRAGFFVYQSANPFSFYHHYLAVIGRTSFLNKGASHAVSIFLICASPPVQPCCAFQRGLYGQLNF